MNNLNCSAGARFKARVETTLAAKAAIAAFILAATPANSLGHRTGKEVVDAVCAECHLKGANGAPKIGDQKAWAERSARGLTGLTQNALLGIRKMPPHGGNAGVSDVEVTRAITYMVNASGGHWTEPIVRTASVSESTGEQVVQRVCANCHASGTGGAPRIGDRAAWIPRAREGIDVLVRSAINGHGGMPPRGGTANLTDGEIRAAIGYMFNPAPVVPSASAPLMPASQDPNHQLVRGIDVYFGAVSAETLRKQLTAGHEAAMHGGMPRGTGYYHLNVSLFDATTHESIRDARVEVRIADPVRGDQIKLLEPMAFNDTVSYGNYVRLPGRGPHTIAVSILKLGETQAVQTKFAFTDEQRTAGSR